MTPADIARYAYAAGFRGEALVIAVAVALPESRGNPDAVGDTTLQDATWGPSIGLWQIRSLKGQRGSGAIRDGSRLHEPAFNARSAYTLYSARGGNFQDWTAYNKGTYKGHLAKARGAVSALGEDISTPPSRVPGAETVPGVETEETVSEADIRSFFQVALGRGPTPEQVRAYLGRTPEETERAVLGTEEARSFQVATKLDEAMRRGV